MKKMFLLSFCIVSSLLSMSQKQLPKVNVENLKNETVAIGSVLSDSVPVVLSFWSTTCKPCILELDALGEQYEDWQEDFKFKVVAVSIDDSRAASKVRALVEGRGWPFTILLDKNQDLKRALNVNTMPQLFVLDKHGNIIYTHTGYTPGSEMEVYEVLKKMK